MKAHTIVPAAEKSSLILKANVTPEEEGLMVLELQGKQQDVREGIAYIEQLGVGVQSLSQDVKRNEQRCTHCGVCVTICPTGALAVEPETRRINFFPEKCIACELCVKICPPRAMEVHF